MRLWNTLSSSNVIEMKGHTQEIVSHMIIMIIIIKKLFD